MPKSKQNNKKSTTTSSITTLCISTYIDTYTHRYMYVCMYVFVCLQMRTNGRDFNAVACITCSLTHRLPRKHIHTYVYTLPHTHARTHKHSIVIAQLLPSAAFTQKAPFGSLLAQLVSACSFRFYLSALGLSSAAVAALRSAITNYVAVSFPNRAAASLLLSTNSFWARARSSRAFSSVA